MPPHWAVAGRTTHDAGSKHIDRYRFRGGLTQVNLQGDVERLAKGGEALPGAVAEKAKVAHFNKAFGQDVLEEARSKQRGMNSSARRVQVLGVPVSVAR